MKKKELPVSHQPALENSDAVLSALCPLLYETLKKRMSSPPTSKGRLHSLKQIIPLTFFRESAGCTLTEIYALSNRERWAAAGAWMLTLFVQILVVFLMLARPRLVPLVCPISSFRISSPAFVLDCFVWIPRVYLH